MYTISVCYDVFTVFSLSFNQFDCDVSIFLNTVLLNTLAYNEINTH